MTPPDASLTVWLSSQVGKVPALDSVVHLLVNDYFIPMCICIVLTALWVGARSAEQRERNVLGIFGATPCMGWACLAVWILNHGFHLDLWPRPYETYESARYAAQLLFYCPSDPSFPSNPAAMAFAAATGIWVRNRWGGAVLFFIAVVWCFARMYAGVHYLSDIAVGASIGALTSYLWYKGWKFWGPPARLVLWVARQLCLA